MVAISPSRCTVEVNGPHFFPYGNNRSYNILKDFKSDHSDGTIKLLFLLHHGDLLNILQATNSKCSLHISVCGNNLSVLGRNLLILKIISAKDFTLDREEDIAFLWDVWYNAEWPATTRERFQVVLKELLDGKWPENVSIPDQVHLEKLQSLFLAWASISSKTEDESSILMEKSKQQRREYIMSRQNGKFKNVDYSKLTQMFTEVFLSNIGVDLDDLTKNNICFGEAQLFFQNSSSRLQSKPYVCVNSTMLHPISQHWQVLSSPFPFYGYAPFNEEELILSAKVGVLTRSCQKILKGLVSCYRQHQESVKIVLYLEDPLVFCYAPSTEKFDVIDCSQIGDNCGLPNVIIAASQRLKDTPNAMLVSESDLWSKNYPSVIQYIEEALLCPVSFIPTIYGLRLKGHVELGAATDIGLRCPNGYPVQLFWEKTPTFRHGTQYSSPVLVRCLERIIFSSFNELVQPWHVEGNQHIQGEIKWMSYTPLTFEYLVDSLTQRVGNDNWLQEVGKLSNLASTFNLARRTIKAWKNGQDVVKCSIVHKVNSVGMAALKLALSDLEVNFGLCRLRLIFIPRKAKLVYVNIPSAFDSSLEFPSIHESSFYPASHFVDNIQFDLRKNMDDETEEMSVSFLLVPDHGIDDDNYFGLLVDIKTSILVLPVSPLKNMRVEKFTEPYPFAAPRGSPPAALEEFQMKVESCVETEQLFTLKIMIKSQEDVSGLKVATNVKEPCESAHDVILSLDQPSGMKPLTISFPHPILADSVEATLHRKDRFIDLISKKALLEPWPCEFETSEDFKLVPSNLHHWKHKGFDSKLKNHLEAQPKPLVPDVSPEMIYVGQMIYCMFKRAATSEVEICYAVRLANPQTESPKYHWVIRVHRPIVTSPQGTPMLILSAYDSQALQTCTKEGGMNDITGKAEKVTIPIETIEQLQLFRYVLRVNSTKVLPNPWQKKKLAEGSPLMVTFVSPLYLDLPNVEIGFTFASHSCGFCQKIPPKPMLCGRCREITYCSAECQRAHWKQHKLLCTRKT